MKRFFRRLRLIPMWLFCGQAVLILAEEIDHEGKRAVKVWRTNV